MKALNLKCNSSKEDNNHDSTLVFGCSSPAVKIFCEFSLFHNKTAEGRRVHSVDEELKEMSEGFCFSNDKCIEFFCLNKSKRTSVLLGQVKITELWIKHKSFKLRAKIVRRGC